MKDINTAINSTTEKHPSNIEAEQALLGSILVNNDIIDEISSIIEFSTPNTDGNTTYSWTNDNTSIGLSSVGNGDIPSFTALNLSPITEVATITVTPTYQNNGVVCIGDKQ